MGTGFVAGTLVMTENGFTPIEDVRQDTLVVDADGEFKRVRSVWSDMASTIVIKGRGSASIECTPDSLFLSYKKKEGVAKPRHAGDMQGRLWKHVCDVADMTANEPVLGVCDDERIDIPLWRLIGRWFRDGYSTERHLDVFFSNDTFLSDGKRFQQLLDEIGIKYAVRNIHSYGWVIEMTSATIHECVTRLFGSRDNNRDIPIWLLSERASKARRAFVQGYLPDGRQVNNTGNRRVAIITEALVGGNGSRMSTRISERRTSNGIIYREEYGTDLKGTSHVDGGWLGKVTRILPGNNSKVVYVLNVDGGTYTADTIAVAC